MIISTNPVIVYAAESKDTGNGNFVFYFVFAIIGSMLLATVVSLLENLINKIKSKSKANRWWWKHDWEFAMILMEF